jgi:hypothetical protein
MRIRRQEIVKHSDGVRFGIGRRFIGAPIPGGLWQAGTSVAFAGGGCALPLKHRFQNVRWLPGRFEVAHAGRTTITLRW